MEKFCRLNNREYIKYLQENKDMFINVCKSEFKKCIKTLDLQSRLEMYLVKNYERLQCSRKRIYGGCVLLRF